MTKKDFELVARALSRTLRREGIDDHSIRLAVLDLATELKSDNERFNFETFVMACFGGTDAEVN